MNDPSFWSKVPRSGVKPKTWVEPHHEVDRLDVERGRLSKEERPAPVMKWVEDQKKRLAARNRERNRRKEKA